VGASLERAQYRETNRVSTSFLFVFLSSFYVSDDLLAHDIKCRCSMDPLEIIIWILEHATPFGLT
jgi:hypothetical protein